MEYDLEYKDLNKLEKDEYTLIDIRDEESFSYGHIMGAINIPNYELEKRVPDISKSKALVLYCATGRISEDVVEDLRAKDFNAFNLKDGYFGYLKDHMEDMLTNDIALKVENSISKKFHKELFSKFAKAISTYDLIQPNDKIAVCISGGKDSMLMAKLFQELKKHRKYPFELVFLVMDPGYSKENRLVIEKNAQMLNVPITIFESNIFENVFSIEKSPCYICARMRRGYLYSKAKELGCNKIALGHHFDDVIETILMGMLYGAQVQTMMPKLHSTNFEGMELIRPMYLIREDDIKRWRDYNELHFIQCACRFTDNCTAEACMKSSNTGSKRKQTKELIKHLKEKDPQIEMNIFRSVENVNLSTIIAYKDENGTHNFLDNYNKDFKNKK